MVIHFCSSNLKFCGWNLVFFCCSFASPISIDFGFSSLLFVFGESVFVFWKLVQQSLTWTVFLLTHRTIPNISNNDIPYTLIIPDRKLGSVLLGWSIQIKITKWGSHMLLILSISPCNFGIMEKKVCLLGTLHLLLVEFHLCCPAIQCLTHCQIFQAHSLHVP